MKQVVYELQEYRQHVDEAVSLINKRFLGTVKAKVLTNGDYGKFMIDAE